MDRDRDLDNMFLSYEVLPDHRYYTSGGYDLGACFVIGDRDTDVELARNLGAPKWWWGLYTVGSSPIPATDSIRPLCLAG